MKVPLLLASLLLSSVVGLAIAFQYEAPNALPPDDAKLKDIDARTEKLKNELAKMRARSIGDPVLSDVEIYLKAAQWIRKYNEFYTKDSGDATLTVLDHGLLRASQAQRGESPWLSQIGYTVARGYRSSVDGSVQPYSITYPAAYGKDATKKWRVDVVLHGRNAGLTEVGFLKQHDGTKKSPKELDFIQLDIYGRGNNAYRWAGETDVDEVLDHFFSTERLQHREQLLDVNRLVLRGFSMGGAGSWHLGLHRPDRWAVVGPGAGFTSTKGYISKFPEPLTPTQETTLHLYDAVDYAENVFDVPVVAYDGADDPQLQAARNIEEALKKSGLTVPFTLLTAPGLKHQFPPEWQKKAEEEYQKHLEKPRPDYPTTLHFVTYTLKYPQCYWLNVLALNKHYERTVVDAKFSPQGYELKTTNVRALNLMLPPSATRRAQNVSIDGQTLVATPAVVGAGLHILLEKRGTHWNTILPERYATDRVRNLQKTSGLQGPIDDAFMNGFLLVRGTGQPWHESTQQFAEMNLKRFSGEWSKFMRGEAPIKNDVDVTPEDLATKHLILFGDPASNALINQVASALPFKWSKDTIAWGGNDYSAEEHVPVLIYPSPLNTDHYIVLNSGHTFRAADFQGTNALLYPRLGDHALLKLDLAKNEVLGAQPVRSGLFDESWRFAVKP